MTGASPVTTIHETAWLRPTGVNSIVVTGLAPVMSYQVYFITSAIVL